MEINNLLEEKFWNFFSNIFNILKERRKMALFRKANEEEKEEETEALDYRNSYSHYRDITVSYSSVFETLLHPPGKLLNIARLSNALRSRFLFPHFSQ